MRTQKHKNSDHALVLNISMVYDLQGISYRATQHMESVQAVLNEHRALQQCVLLLAVKGGDIREVRQGVHAWYFAIEANASSPRAEQNTREQFR